MAKQSFQDISEIQKHCKLKKFSPVYFFTGEDSFSLNEASEALEKAITPLLSSEFDKQIYFGSSATINEVIDFAQSFPFGDGKKFILVKEFEKMKEEKQSTLLERYAKDPPEFSILVLLFNGTIKASEKGFLKIFAERDFIFEAKALKEVSLVNWIMQYTDLHKKQIARVDAEFLLSLVGENRGMLEMQLEKIISSLGGQNEITLKEIEANVVSTKEYTIFNLQDAISAQNKADAVKIAFQFLEREGIILLLAMLNKYFTSLMQLPEMMEQKLPEQMIARVVGTHPYYLKNFIAARKYFSDAKLLEISRALFESDVAVKSTPTDHKTILLLLLQTIFSE